MISPTRYSVLTSLTDIFRRKTAIFLFCLLPALATAAPLDVNIWTLSASHELATMTPGTLNSAGTFNASPYGGISIGGIPGVDVTTQIPGGQHLVTINGKTVYPGGYTEWLNFLAIQESWGDYSYRQNYSVESTEYAISGDKFSVVTVNLAPVITTSPTSKSVVAGNSVTFSVVATGTPAPTYQWKFNGTAISGATSSSYSIASVTTAQAGSYSVAVTNIRSNTTSGAATLTVLPPAPVITTPQAAGAALRESFIYPIAASNTPTSYGATGLPTGLIVNTSTGLISGMPTASGTFSATLSATNSTGTGTATLTVIVSPTVAVTTLAGTLGVSGSTNATGTAASFNGPTAVTADSSGNLYVADKANHIIRKITTTGVVTTLAGSAGNAGSLDGTGTNARFDSPAGITCDSSGNLFVTEMGNHTIRKITPSGLVSLFAGATGVTGSTDNTIGTQARFNSPAGIVIDSSGNLFVADFQNQTIRKITATGSVTTLAGLVGISGSIDGTTAAARFSLPYALALDGQTTLYVGDSGNHVIRKITLATTPANVSTLVGQSGVSGNSDNVVMTSVSRGTYYAALFSTIGGLAVDQTGFLYASDTSNHMIRRIDPTTGMVTTLAGMVGTAGSVNGVGNTARFNYPNGLAIDSNGLVYVADQTSNAIRVLSFGPNVITHPQSQTITSGNSVNFTVVATASPYPAFQWSKDNVAIAGAISATYSIANTQAANAGAYTVTLSNTSGTVTSNAATLTVTAAPTNSSSSGSSSGSSGGGGGAPSPMYLAVLVLLASYRFLRTFKSKF